MSEVVSSVPSAAVRRAVRTAMIAAVAISFVSVEANAYSKKVENACRGDYDTHCPAYKVGSTALRDCITLAGKRGNLSKQCFDALVDAGMVPRKYLKKK
ncbi:MAG: hypothetical protein Q8K85_16695 [Hyphomicrobium sp.]|nr:hypothetical protein [Hyphomicrobium sp.]